MNFAANLSMLFGEHGFPDRFGAAAANGFRAVEYLFPYEWSKADLASALKAHDLKQVLFNMPPGDWQAGERGLAGLPGRETEFRDGVARALDYASALDCKRLHCMAGVARDDASVDAQLVLYRENVSWASRQCAAAGVQLLIEPLNPFDNPGYLLSDFGLAVQIVRELAEPDGSGPRLQFDIYHCQRTHGETASFIRRTADITAHYQIAGTPARHEPDNGDLPLLEVLHAVRDVNPQLWIGCEYRPAGETAAGLGWMAPFLAGTASMALNRP